MKLKTPQISSVLTSVAACTKISPATSYDKTMLLSNNLNKVMQKLISEANKTWYSKDVSRLFIAESLFSEAGELLGEFVKEQRKNTTRNNSISLELGDVLYFNLKYIQISKVDVESSWSDVAFKFARYYENKFIEDASAKELSKYISHLANQIMKNEEENNYTSNNGLNSMLIFLAVLKIAEKRKIDPLEALSKKLGNFEGMKVRLENSRR